MARLLVIGLDGYELTLADSMIRMGGLPSLASIREKSARFLLDHGSARGTGLAWEHVSSGLSPDDADRWSAVFFNKETYEIWQEGALFAPFPSKIEKNTVVFDFPYFDLSRATNVYGAVGWGAHDPGVEFVSNPRTSLTNSSKGMASIRPISGSMALLGPLQNAVKPWAMLWRKVLLHAQK